VALVHPGRSLFSTRWKLVAPIFAPLIIHSVLGLWRWRTPWQPGGKRGRPACRYWGGKMAARRIVVFCVLLAHVAALDDWLLHPPAAFPPASATNTADGGVLLSNGLVERRFDAGTTTSFRSLLQGPPTEILRTVRPEVLGPLLTPTLMQLRAVLPC
jgi:hypothetical protein